MDYFSYYEGVYMCCEMPQCFRPMVDVNHIDARGMGGNPSGNKDVIENLMGMCRECHNKYGDRKETKGYLKVIHLQFMKDFGRDAI